MVPADQRLERADVAVGKAELGLVVQDELVAGQRLAQLPDEGEPVRVVVVLLGAVAHHARVADLGQVQGDVGVLQELVEVRPVVGAEREPDARLGRDRQSGELEGLLDDREQTLESRTRFALADDPRQDDAELVAAETGDRVTRAERVAESTGDPDEQLVPVGVPEGVVDVLEAVEVDQRDRAERRRPHLGQLRDPAREHPAVRQAGELVELREVGVGPGVLPQPARRHETQAGQDDIEGEQSRCEIDVQAVQPHDDVGADRRVRQIDLEDADARAIGSRDQRPIDLDDLRADRSRVVGVRVEVGELGLDLTLGGLQRIRLWGLDEAGPVVGEDHVTVQVADP